jgi:hypothetical protein
MAPIATVAGFVLIVVGLWGSMMNLRKSSTR